MALCSLFKRRRRRIEEPPYTVEETLDEATEIRRYAPRLAAEARLPGGDDPLTRGRAFRVLFDYIAGNNSTDTRVAMTAPVESRDGGAGGGAGGRGRDGARIPMTVPVQSANDGTGYAMRFFLPAGFTSETAPQPRDGRVRVVEIPETLMAVRRFTGLRGGIMVARQAAILRKALGGSVWRAAGDPVAWFYDPPSTLPFLRRNEVAVPVARAAD
ncbi:SOUL family heme-binding protein [Roseospira navarrensis]|uniref:Heme-binding protein n=1 Tax=Roseospira navarrensis TaxID=140058 RepID=A0A7X2D3F6_9PROT|nr:heme-binding protein [Roseospira navarrensis]MQX36726.1 heme-binding protein [Roseospira navarrensis]